MTALSFISIICYHNDMNTYVALLRGINVGGNGKVSMAELAKIFESLAFTHVSTYINSGNIIFSTDEHDEQILTKTIEKVLSKKFGFTIPVVLRDKKTLQKLSQSLNDELQNNNEMKTDILFPFNEFNTKKSLTLIASNPEVDTLFYAHGAIVWSVQRSNYTKSGMKKFIGTILYKNMTARNINTVRKLAERMQ